ncbi:hypothetical protein [Mycolicibacterium sp.]|uniref:hypothetical protein n=1 Tax=Mycolicibacterium sp. TaxID=2320850 RepID=UPI0037C777B3
MDVLPGAAVLTAAVLTGSAMPTHSPWWWVCVTVGALAILWSAANRLVLPKGRRPRRLEAALLPAVAALCAALAALSYLTVGQQDSAVRDARARVAGSGPHMVEQLLSYHPDTIRADFERARTLASDDYRPQLAAQQQAVQQANPVRNEYWAVASSVLDATAHQVTMLLFLEGERGTVPTQRYITASVRARFVGSGDSTWRVDHLDVVTASTSNEPKP